MPSASTTVGAMIAAARFTLHSADASPGAIALLLPVLLLLRVVIGVLVLEVVVAGDGLDGGVEVAEMLFA